MGHISNFIFRRRWNYRNKHNDTHAKTIFDMSKVQIGKATYGDLNVLTYNNENILKIGNYCSIGPNTWFIVSADHSLENLSTYPFKAKILSKGVEKEGISKGNIIVEDDVWLGCNTTILSGVHIGQGAVVAAGAVVTKDIPDYAVVAGVPAKIVRYRFDEEYRQILKELDFSKLDTAMIKEHEEELYSELNLSRLEWFPRKCK